MVFIREQWPSRMIFIFAAVGSAAGLGNLWRFPYLTYKFGGGAFLIPYLLALIILGLPLLILEFGLGQKFQKSAVGSLKEIKSWAGTIGWWSLGMGFMILTYYGVVMAWSLRYFFSSFTTAWSGNAESYFYTNILQLSSGINIIGGINIPILLCLIGVWLMIYFSVYKGVHSVSNVVKITMPLPIIIIFILLFRALSLEGASTGLIYYLKPTFSALASPEVWIAAASQIFFTLSLGFGVMIAYASYNKKGDIANNSIWTALINSIISILAGFVVFGTLGFLALQSGVNVPDVVTSGPGLAFVVFPEALTLMPLAWLFSLLFFITLLSLGIDSAFSLVEGVMAAFKDKKKVNTKKLAFWVSLPCFLIGILYTTGAGLYFLDVIDHFVTNYGLILVGITQALIVGWTVKGKKVMEHIKKHSNWFPTNIWWWTIKLIAPALLIAVLGAFFLEEIKAPYGGYPVWAITIGWAAVFIPLIIGWFLNKYYE